MEPESIKGRIDETFMASLFLKGKIMLINRKINWLVDNHHCTCHDCLLKWVSSLKEFDFFKINVTKCFSSMGTSELSCVVLKRKGKIGKDKKKRSLIKRANVILKNGKGKLWHERWYYVFLQSDFEEQFPVLTSCHT